MFYSIFKKLYTVSLSFMDMLYRIVLCAKPNIFHNKNIGLKKIFPVHLSVFVETSIAPCTYTNTSARK